MTLNKAITNQLSQFNRVLISQVDFQNCYGIAKHILDNNLYESDTHTNRYLLEGMCVGMVVAYCRPFSENNDGNLSNNFIRELNKGEKKIHHQALYPRNKALAHSDSDVWEMDPHYIEVGNNERQLMPFHNCVHDPVPISFTKELMELAKKQLKQCIVNQKRLEINIGEYIPIFDINA